jgi:DNA polymerase-3 subunit alpha
LKGVSLHHHSTFSYQDGYGTPAEHVALAAEYGMSSLALTEHGNVSSHVGLEKAALKAGIKPIFGLEAYTALEAKSDRKCHLTLLAMDQIGYANLMALTSRSWAEGFHRWPTVMGPMLADHHEGLIVLSGCSDSLLSCSYLGGKMIPEEEASTARAYEMAGKFKDLLGDRYYLECQIFPELERSQELNACWEEMGEDLKIPLVATFDVHTLRKGDHEIRALLHAAGRGNNTIAQQLSSWEYEVPDYIPTSDMEMWERAKESGLSYKAARAALAATAEIADRCTVTLPKAERFRFEGTEADLKW